MRQATLFVLICSALDLLDRVFLIIHYSATGFEYWKFRDYMNIATTTLFSLSLFCFFLILYINQKQVKNDD